MRKTPVLNWYSKNKRLIKGLKSALKTDGMFDRFVTIRLGSKWANKLNPDDCVAISVSDNPEKPNIIGYAEVVKVSKDTIWSLQKHDFAKNIGAKDWRQVYCDMRSIYGPKVKLHSVISIIELIAAKKPQK